jgi:OOP family OmpA-OmpF porin
MKTSTQLLAAGMASLCVASVQAQSTEPGFYVGGSIGQSMWKGDDAFDLDTSKTGGKIHVGYEFSPFFGIELGAVELGKFDYRGGSIRADGLFLDAVGKLAFTPDWAGLARVGAFRGRLDDGSRDDDGTSFKFGLGVQYSLTPNAAIRAEYERYRFDALNSTPDTDLLSVGLNYRF